MLSLISMLQYIEGRANSSIYGSYCNYWKFDVSPCTLSFQCQTSYLVKYRGVEIKHCITSFHQKEMLKKGANASALNIFDF